MAKFRSVVFEDQEVIWLLKEGQRAFWRPAQVSAKDRLVRNGGLHGAFKDKNLWTFRPDQASENLDGKGEPLPDYAVRCPFGKKGDILYVKEAVRISARPMTLDSILDYRADKTSLIVSSGGCVCGPNSTLSLGSPLMDFERHTRRWRSPSTMPEAAARLWLRIKSVEIHRLGGTQWTWRIAHTVMRRKPE